MNTQKNEITIDIALSMIPTQFRNRLIKNYKELKSSFLESKYKLCGLKAGKLCEIIIRYLQHNLTGSFTAFGSKIQNFKNECDALEQTPRSSGSESFRVLIPRAISFLYTLRNKRDIGHVGGDVDANEIDAIVSLKIADWCISEIIRNVHSLSIEEAQGILDSIAERNIPFIWDVMGKKRVLDNKLSFKYQVLLLLYSNQDIGIPIEDLFDWTEYSRINDFKSRVISPMHKERIIEYEKESKFVFISPKGIKIVEEEIIPNLKVKGT
jgi:hypothetical protein